MSSYTTRDVVRLTALSPNQVRQLVQQGWVSPARDSRGGLRFDFAMIGRLKRAHQLIRDVSPRRLGAALRRLEGTPDLDRLAVVGGELVVRQGDSVWEARTGQVPLDFDEPEYSVISAFPAPTPVPARTDDWTAEDWFELACDRDGFDEDGAIIAYQRALELDPGHLEARVGLASAEEARGDAFAALPLLESALQDDPGHPLAWQLYGTCLAQLGRDDEALVAFDNALESDPYVAELHERAAELCDRLGLTARAASHREQLRELTTEEL